MCVHLLLLLAVHRRRRPPPFLEKGGYDNSDSKRRKQPAIIFFSDPSKPHARRARHADTQAMHAKVSLKGRRFFVAYLDLLYLAISLA